MDSKDLESKIKEYFLRLPPDLQEIVGKGEWIDKIQEIGKKNGLNIEQEGQLQKEVMLVMLGIIHPDKFLWDIQGEIGLSKEKIETLIKESGEQIFIPVRQKLIKVYADNAVADDQDDTLSETETSALSENRNDMLADIENPPKSEARVLNENTLKPTMPSSMPIKKSEGAIIPVPRAPYAANTPSNGPAMSSVPLTAKPVTDILNNKLKGAFALPTKETDHSIKGVGSSPSGSMSTGGDSYREPIE